MTILVQSCSATKRDVEASVPALSLYDGYFYKIIKKARREGGLPEDVEILILSAEYGLIDCGREIRTYDRRMNAGRAEELSLSVADRLSERIDAGGHDTVVVNAAKTYRKALEHARERLNADFRLIPGDGIGRKGSNLKQFLHGDTDCTEEWV